MSENFDDDMPEHLKETMSKENSSKREERRDKLDEILAKDKSYFIPWETVELPSKGVYYDNMSNGRIRVRPMGVDVDKMMSNQRLVKSGELINKIVEACVELPEGMTVYDLLGGDQLFLLYYLRGITHGQDYEFSVQCPSCGQTSTYTYDLNELSNTIKAPHNDYLVEPMTVHLPKMSETIGISVDAIVRLVRVRDISVMTRKKETIDPLKRGIARNKSNGMNKNAKKEASDSYLEGMASQVVGFMIDGEQYTDRRKDQLLDRLHSRDTATIRDFIDSISPGIDNQIEVTCTNSECERVFTVPLPFSENFFRPS